MSQQQTTGRYDLPVRRETPEESIEERLTSNAYNNIIPARYLRRDEEGNSIEEPEDLFERVAKNISLGEVPYFNQAVYVSQSSIKPHHPHRDDIIDEVFGDRNEVKLTEDNIKYFAYDEIVENDLPEELVSELEEVRYEFQEMMERLQFMPNSPTLMNAGDELQQLSACFVDSPTDDMEDIHDTAKEASLIFQSGGGMGYAFSRLRPKGDTVGSTGGIASGPITFMETYDQMCKTVAQGGTRRGAQMGIMRVDHPDIIEFIHAKNKDVSLAHALMLNDPKDPENTSMEEAIEEARELIDEDGRVPKHLRNACEAHLSNFNISVGITDRFMEALKNDEEFTFINTRTDEPHVATPETERLWTTFGLGEYVEAGEVLSVPAKEVWDHIIEGAHENGEPGVIYLERANNQHSFDPEEYPDHEILATNPCGEQPLEEYEACNLGHINLSTVADEGSPDWREYSDQHIPDHNFDGYVQSFLDMAIDWDELDRRVEYGTRFLDNVVTMSDFPIDEIEETVSNMRKVGLGVMGLAQLYIQLGVKYGSPAANEVARQIMVHINHKSKEVSRELAVERGSFGEWHKSKYANPADYPEWFEKQTGEDAQEWAAGFPIRNHNTTTIAPTGTTSMIGNTTGGCEPIYNVAYYKNVGQDIQGEEMLVEFDDYFLEVLEANDIDVEEAKRECQEQMQNNEFDGVDSLETVPDAIGELFVTTGDLSAKQHAAIQCACQDGVDSAISKTVNAPSDSTLEDTDEAFRYVYDHGGKGVTYYRDGTRSKQVITTRAKNKDMSDELLPADILEMLEEEAREEEVDQVLDVIKRNDELQSALDVDEIERAGSDGNLCPDCEEGELEMGEGCEKCSNPDCSYAKCEV